METKDVLADAFMRINGGVHRICEGLDAAALAFRPDADANSIAWLVWHLSRNQDDHVADLAGRDQVWVQDDWADRLEMNADPHDTGYGHSSDQVAAIRPNAPEALTAYHDAVYARTLEYLATIDAAELDRIVDESWDPPVSAGVRLVSVINDNMQHMGQAAYVRGIFERLS